MITHVFAYGSLLSPESLRSTLPGVELGAVHPARLCGYLRIWDVAFPNDGSQSDKAYFDVHGGRPPFVLFANISPRDPPASVSGILIPVTERDLDRLRSREGRYDLVDVTEQVRSHRARPEDAARCVGAFVGRSRFTRVEDVRRGVTPGAYARRIEAGLAFWRRHAPGFDADADLTTAGEAPRTVELRRVDG